jgi:hypothetical protein
MTKFVFDSSLKGPLSNGPVPDRAFKESLPGLDQIADNLQSAISFDAMKIKEKSKTESLNAGEREGIAKLTKSLRDIASYRKEARANDKWSSLSDEEVLDYLLAYIAENPNLKEKVIERLLTDETDNIKPKSNRKRQRKYMDSGTSRE